MVHSSYLSEKESEELMFAVIASCATTGPAHALDVDNICKMLDAGYGITNKMLAFLSLKLTPNDWKKLLRHFQRLTYDEITVLLQACGEKLIKETCLRNGFNYPLAFRVFPEETLEFLESRNLWNEILKLPSEAVRSFLQNHAPAEFLKEHGL